MPDDALGAFAAVLLAICGALLVLLVYTLGRQLWLEQTHTCVQYHEERRAAYTQFMQAGKVTVPVYHPARTVSVCDRWVAKDSR